jgi:3-methyl-2-oxobutanoate hydroxymethyltransferase
MARKMIHDFCGMKQAREEITWSTVYDYPTAQFVEGAGLDMVLVGDSLGMCVYGYSSTIPVTMDQCVVHREAVRRGAPNTFVVGDMPFMSHQSPVGKAVPSPGPAHAAAEEYARTACARPPPPPSWEPGPRVVP